MLQIFCIQIAQLQTPHLQLLQADHHTARLINRNPTTTNTVTSKWTTGVKNSTIIRDRPEEEQFDAR